MAPPRNAPCPCGSGKKYKKCCFGKMDARTRKRVTLLVGLMALGTAALGVTVGWYTGTGNGLLAGVAGVIVIGIYLGVRNPPKSTGRTGADSINFGK